MNLTWSPFLLKIYLKVMKALFNPTRVKVIKMLQSRELCVCELQAALELAKPFVAKYLRILEKAGVVESRKAGMWVNYRLADTAESIYSGHVQSILRDWLNDDLEIQKIVRQASLVDRLKFPAVAAKEALLATSLMPRHPLAVKACWRPGRKRRAFRSPLPCLVNRQRGHGRAPEFPSGLL